MTLHLPILRIAIALLVNIVLGILAWRAGAVRASGLEVGILIGTCIFVGLGWQGFLILVTFFVLGSVLTWVGYGRKLELGAAEEQAGARGASHALANAGFATIFALASWITGDWQWPLAFVAAFATASMDTAGSELGPLLGRRTISLKNLKPVPPGTEGGVSLEGTIAGLIAAFFVAIVGAFLFLIPMTHVGLVVAGALAGNLYEGMLGARRLISHAWLNATNTLVGAGVAVALVALIF
jgi:uncharacterized protein (TIGR00297 family)